MREIDMGNDRELFSEDSDGLPLYEGRMVGQFDHRAKVYKSGRGRAVAWVETPFGHQDKQIRPQWYIPVDRLPDKTRSRVGRYRVGYCKVASPTNERTVIAALLPRNCLAGDIVPTFVYHSDYEWAYMLWLSVANSFSLDFLARQKVALHLTYTVVDSLPFPRLSEEDPRINKLVTLALHLTCNAPEMSAYWNMMAERGWVEPIAQGSTPPGFIDPEERLDARAQIDAIVALEVFGLSRDELDYIVETFPIVKEADIAMYGDYRTKLLILEHYDAMTPAPTSPR